jgi:hypothetical protein
LRIPFDVKLLIGFALGFLLSTGIVWSFAHFQIQIFQAVISFRCDPDPDIGCIVSGYQLQPIWGSYLIFYAAWYGGLLCFLMYVMGTVYRILNKRILNPPPQHRSHTAWDWQGAP